MTLTAVIRCTLCGEPVSSLEDLIGHLQLDHGLDGDTAIKLAEAMLKEAEK